MSAWSCCGEYNDHAEDCVWNDKNPNSYENLERRLAEAEKIIDGYKQGFNEHWCTACENCCGNIKESLCKENDMLKAKLEKMRGAAQAAFNAHVCWTYGCADDAKGIPCTHNEKVAMRELGEALKERT